MKKYVLPVTISLSTMLLALISFFGGMWYSSYQADKEISDHDLLSKRIFLSKPNDLLVNFEPMRADLRKDLAYYDGKVSLYFEYLPTGTSMRFGDTNQLVAASLLKVPVVMELYRLAEMDKIALDDEVTIKQEWLDDGYGELYKKGAGQTLTLRELVELTLEQSDNTALNAIQSIVDEHDDDKTKSAYDSLDVDFGTDRESLAMSARAYASFMKCLYFACYLSADSSQEIMSYLTKSTYGSTGRIGKYIPDSVPIAHKIGVAGNSVQSDCGIVYVPNRNYILCIMLDEEQDRGGEAIAQISKKVYDYVISK
ncbi:MAG: serine hydrolase [Candidatus Saccharimonadales bacterium]